MSTEPPGGGGGPPGHPLAAAGARFDGPLPEPPTGLQPALQWGDPTPAPARAPRKGPPPPYSRLAVAALVAGVLVGAGGLALVLGAVALLRLRRTGRRGTGLALTGMALTLAWAGALYAVDVAVLSKPSVRDAAGVVVRRGELPVDQLRVGDCVERWTTSDEIGTVTVVPCTTAHAAEVFHTFDLTGKAYPGTAEVTRQGQSGCVGSSKSAVKEGDLPKVRVALFKPLASSWKRDDHRVTCLAVQNTGTITRSVRK